MIDSNNIIIDEKLVLYFADIPVEATKESIKSFLGEHFSKYISSINIKKPGSAIVIFNKHSIAKEVKHKLNLTNFGNNLVRIMWHEPHFKSNSYINENKNIFVKNIPDGISPREFYEYFYEFGEIASAKMNLDKQGNHMGYGYINYESPISAVSAINKSNGQPIFKKFPKYTVEVSYFKKGTQRDEHANYLDYLSYNSSKAYETICSVYVKNINPTTNIEKIKNIFSDNIGDIISFMPNYDKNNNEIVSIIITYKEESSADKAAKELNNKHVEGFYIEVEKLQISDKKKFNKSSKRFDNNANSNIANHYNNNNNNNHSKIFIKNVPTNLHKEEIINTFSKFGKVLNCVMHTYNSTSKDPSTGTFKDTKFFTGNVQITFDSINAAENAINKYNGKFLEKYNSWKHPLSISMFKSYNERKLEQQQSNILSNFSKEYPTVYNEVPVLNNNIPYMKSYYDNNYNPNYGYNINNTIYKDYNNQFNNKWNNNTNYDNTFNKVDNNNNSNNNNNNNNQYINYYNNKDINNINSQFENINISNNRMKYVNNNNNTGKQFNKISNDDNSNPYVLDLNYYESLLDENQKKEYMGELIFNNINKHALVKNERISYNEVGKITGMILGINDINEIILACNNYNELSSRIKEALKLLRN